MDTIEAIHTRRSIRKFLDVPVEWDKVGTILDSGRVAPSAGNLQAWKFVVVRDAEKRKQMAEAALQQYWMADAPVHILIVAQLDKMRNYYGTRGERLYAVQDCAMAAVQMMLTAHDIGLGTCFVSAFDDNVISRIFSLPPDARPQGILVVGYTDEKPEPPVRYRLENVAWLEVYSAGMGRVGDFDATVWNWRLVEKGIKYTKEAASDIGKVTAKDRNKFLELLKESGKKIREKLEKRAKKKKNP